MTKSDLALRTTLIARIASQFSHELAFGMSDPGFGSSPAGYTAERFLREMEFNMDELRAAVSAVGDSNG